MIGASSRVWWLRPFHLLLRATLVACSHMPTPGLSVLSGRPAAAMGHGSWRSLSVSSSGLLLVNTLDQPARGQPIAHRPSSARAQRPEPLAIPLLGCQPSAPKSSAPPASASPPWGRGCLPLISSRHPADSAPDSRDSRLGCLSGKLRRGNFCWPSHAQHLASRPPSLSPALVASTTLSHQLSYLSLLVRQVWGTITLAGPWTCTHFGITVLVAPKPVRARRPSGLRAVAVSGSSYYTYPGSWALLPACPSSRSRPPF